jgi:hypothetical protein
MLLLARHLARLCCPQQLNTRQKSRATSSIMSLDNRQLKLTCARHWIFLRKCRQALMGVPPTCQHFLTVASPDTLEATRPYTHLSGLIGLILLPAEKYWCAQAPSLVHAAGTCASALRLGKQALGRPTRFWARMQWYSPSSNQSGWHAVAVL